MGARHVDAIDVEEWAYDNMRENCLKNKVEDINCFLGGLDTLRQLDQQYDLILANINKNILMKQLPTYLNKLSQDGRIILSGFFEVDQADFESLSTKHNFKIHRSLHQTGWAAISLLKY
jgi:ribosomal protein L11 methyltransferase